MIIVVAGATGTGKTTLSLDLVEALGRLGHGAQIVNADAMQLYRGMDIGTAKLPVGERRGIPHHCFDIWPVTQTASVAEYRAAARAAIGLIEDAGDTAILVGGSGLYLEAVLRELDFPATDLELRADLERQADALGPDAIWRRLAEADPQAASRIPSGNLRRVIRALEVVTITGAPYAASSPVDAPAWRPSIRFVIEAEDAPLAERLAVRATAMWSEGLLDEVRHLLADGLADGVTASRAIGYAQAMAVLSGDMTLDEALAETIRLTWRTVRRQRSWFARDPDAIAVPGDSSALPAILAALEALEAPGNQGPRDQRASDERQ